MGVLQPVQPVFQPLHRDAAQIDDIAAHRALVRPDQGGHQIAVLQDRLWLRYDAVPQVLFDHDNFARLFLVGLG